jgi:uncharacterized protein YndB with AHSA1/START domain
MNDKVEVAASPLVVRRTIDAGAEELFDAWLDPQALSEWMLPEGVSAIVPTVDARVGGKYKLIMTTGSGDVPHDGVYLTIDRPHTLAFTWNSPYTHGIETKVTVEFRAAANGTEVVLTHELLPVGEVEGHRRGWTEAIANFGRTYGARKRQLA